MNTEELERVLRKIPDLAPSPDLEARVVRATRPRFRGLIPAAAALLFCAGVVLSVLPTLSTPAGKNKREPGGAFLISFLKEEGKWKVFPPEFRDELPQAKARGVAFVGPSDTPWGLVQHVRRACAKAGFSQIEWRIADKTLKIRIPPPQPPPNPGAPQVVRLEEITVILVREKDTILRRVGNRALVESDEDLMYRILTMRTDYKKAGKTEFPIHIDAAADVPWQEVGRVIEMCTKEGFVEFNLGPPDPPFKIDPPLWKPDQRLFPKPEDK